MKRICLYIFSFLICRYAANAQQPCPEFYKDIVSIIDQYHYKPHELNDEWSEKIFNGFIKDLDPMGTYFLQSDIDELSKYKKELDEAFKTPDCRFISRLTELYKKRLIEADTIIGKITAKSLNFSVKQTLKYTKDDEIITYAATEKELHLRWEKMLKYETLLYVFNAESDSIQPFRMTSQQLAKRTIQMQEKVRKKEKRRIHRILNYAGGFENLIALFYLNSLTQTYDPHTMYFSKDIKESFESSISTQALSYGLEISENKDGAIEIDHLLPGGPAWKTNEIHKGDILLQLKWKNKSVDLTDIDVSEVNSILGSTATDKIELTLKNKNGQVKTISLKKDKVRVEENIINSYLLKGAKTIGYIALPNFYSETENTADLGCANDVAKQILKLQGEKIGGLILDLRDNGGGSMQEALELAGIFIDFGPICLTCYKDSKPEIRKDLHRGTIYTGPMVVLVNNMSASASELLAAALQDYNAAIIAGSRTYGKATAQVVIPVDTAVKNSLVNTENLKDDNDYLKLTIGKFYRVTGKSHQRIGIIPDIALPIITDDDECESNDPYALPNDSIYKKVLFTPSKSYPIKALKDKSTARLTTDPVFKRIQIINDSIDLLRNKTLIELDMESYKSNEQVLYSLLRESEKLVSHKSNLYIVEANRYNQQLSRIDDYSKEIDNQAIKNIEEDIYIEEGYSILNDLSTIKP